MPMPTDIGIVDLGMGFPYKSIEEKKRTYDFFRANLKDKQSLEEMEFPAQYMFKHVPDVVADHRRRRSSSSTRWTRSASRSPTSG